jgi:hypothetical protein
LEANKIRLTVDDALMDDAGNNLDGQWTDGADTMPSGDGAAGGDFSYRINSLPADGNRDAGVSVTDLVNIAQRMGTSTTVGNYSAFFDINADAEIQIADLSTTAMRMVASSSNQLPAGDPLLAPEITDAPAPRLTAELLKSIAETAIYRLAAAGANADQLSRLNSVKFQIVDLPGAQLGVASLGGVEIDINGAGHGYFVDDSPLDDSEFELLAAGGGLQAGSDSEAFGRIDLLTVVLHELGHILGFDHGDEDGLMGATLEVGVRYADLDEVFADEVAVAAFF